MSTTSIPVYGQLVSVRMIRRVWAAVSIDPHATVRELAARLDIAHSEVSKAMTILCDAGYVERPSRTRRARRVVVPFVEVRHEHD